MDRVRHKHRLKLLPTRPDSRFYSFECRCGHSIKITKNKVKVQLLVGEVIRGYFISHYVTTWTDDGR